MKPLITGKPLSSLKKPNGPRGRPITRQMKLNTTSKEVAEDNE